MRSFGRKAQNNSSAPNANDINMNFMSDINMNFHGACAREAAASIIKRRVDSRPLTGSSAVD